MSTPAPPPASSVGQGYHDARFSTTSPLSTSKDSPVGSSLRSPQLKLPSSPTAASSSPSSSSHNFFDSHPPLQSSNGAPLLPPIPRVASVLESSERGATAAKEQETAGGDSNGDRYSGTHGGTAETNNAWHSRQLSFERNFENIHNQGFELTSSSSPLVPLSPSLSNDYLYTHTSSSSSPHSAHLPPRLSGRALTSPDGTIPMFSPGAASPISVASGSGSGPGSASGLGLGPGPQTLGVPYSSTTARQKPRAGNKPLPSNSSFVNGIKQHERTSTQRAEPHSSKLGKGKFSLLNPVSLLMRRRSSQAVENVKDDKSSTKSLIVPPMDLPDDFDPRIKGNKVHDFSAPRPRRNLSYSDASIGSLPRLELTPEHSEHSLVPIDQSPNHSRAQSSDATNTRRSSTQHTPVFVERFDEDEHDQGHSSAIQAEALANKDFVVRNSYQSETKSSEPFALPLFARRSQQLQDPPLRPLSDATTATVDSSEVSPVNDPSSISSALGISAPVSPQSPQLTSGGPLSTHAPQQQDSEPAALEKTPPPQPDSIHLSVGDAFFKAPGLPRHFKSNASRFSFQASADSMAEERLLEEKHKQRHSQQAEHSKIVDEEEDEDEDDFFDEDAMYDQDEMETMNAPPPDMTFQHKRGVSSITMGEDEMIEQFAGFHFVPGMDSRTSVASANSQTSPDPAQLHFYAMANTNLANPPLPQADPESPVLQHSSLQQQQQQQQEQQEEQQQRQPSTPPLSPQPSGPALQEGLEDAPQQKSPMSPNSFYFDDGMIDSIDDIDIDDGASFNEDQFDDPSFLKQPSSALDETLAHSDSTSELNKHQSVYDVNGVPFLMHNPRNIPPFASHSPYSEASAEQNGEAYPVPQDTLPARADSHSQESDLGIAAYSRALSEAMQKADADGRFARQRTSVATSVSNNSELENQENVPPAPPFNTAFVTSMPSSMPSHHVANSSIISVSTHRSHQSYSGFDFGFQEESMSTLDDDLDFPYDDPDIVAAANAEALANDDEGFYGQEFGFYSTPRKGSDADLQEAMNGGFFGPPGIDIVRQKSVKEPNLTPITERSEFSTRNSFIGGGAPWSPMSAAFPSPSMHASSISAARGMTPLGLVDEENMSLADLKKQIRANAYGGSNGSLGSDFSNLSNMSPVNPNYSPVYPNNAGNGSNHLVPTPRSSGGVPMGWTYSDHSNGSFGSGNGQTNDRGSNASQYSLSPIGLPAAVSTASSDSAPSPAQADLPSSLSPSGQAQKTTAQAPIPPPVTLAPPFVFDDSNTPTPRKPAVSSPVLGADGFPAPPTPPTAKKAPPTALRQVQAPAAREAQGSPTRSQHAPSQRPQSAEVAPPTMQSPFSSPVTSPRTSALAASGYGHMRTGSGTESVAYVREPDGTTGNKRWVMERRRTSEQGFVEVLNRTVVEGGRI